MMIYCPATVAAVIDILCSVARLLLRLSFSVLRSYDRKTMMIYCPTAVATVLNKWCSVASLQIATTPSISLTTCYWYSVYIYDILLLSYDVPVHMKSSQPKKGLKQFATITLAVMTYTN